ncbi:MAG: hypothetical protein WCF85_10620 [Rhodospirillaceae bacterium]
MTEPGDSQRQFAGRVGLSQGRITQLVKEGLPLLGNGRIDVDAALRWLEQNLDHARSARAKGASPETVSEPPPRPEPVPKAKPVPPAPPRQAASPVAPAAPATGGVTMAEARRQHEIVRVANARLKFDKERGKLVNKDDVKILVFNRARKERNAHLAWIMRASPLMAADLQVDPTLMFSVLDRHVREHLSDLAKIPGLELPE